MIDNTLVIGLLVLLTVAFLVLIGILSVIGWEVYRIIHTMRQGTDWVEGVVTKVKNLRHRKKSD